MIDILIGLVFSFNVQASVPGANLRIAAPTSVGLYLQTKFDGHLNRLRFEECFHGDEHCIPIGLPKGYDVNLIAHRLLEMAEYREKLVRNRRRQNWIAGGVFTAIATAIGADAYIVGDQPLVFAGFLGASLSSFLFAVVRDSNVIMIDRSYRLKKTANLRDYFSTEKTETFVCESETEYREAANLVTKFVSLLNVDDEFCQKVLR